MIIFLSILIGIASGVFSSFIGGGGGVIAVPLLLMMGLPPYSAVSTPKISALGIAFGSLAKFYKTSYIKWQHVPVLLGIAVLAAVIGANLLLITPEFIVNRIVAVLLLISAILLYVNKDIGTASRAISSARKIAGYIVYFITEGLRAAFGSGFGMLTTIGLVYFLGFTMLESSATKRISGVVVSGVALAVFLFKGIINIEAGIGLLIGSVIGSYIGTHWAIKAGDTWVKYIFTAFAVIVAILIFSGANIVVF